MIRPRDLPVGTGTKIRRAAPTDVAEIDAIERGAFIDPWDYSTFLEALICYSTTFFVAESSGRVAGFVIGALEDTGEHIYGHICNLAVLSEYRKSGIGKMLVTRVENQFAHELASGVQLEVRASNTAAQQFYRKLGYRDVFVIGSYYSNGEDAIVMMRWFRF